MNNNNLQFDIYKKETNVNHFITTESNLCFEYKMVSFNFLDYRLLTIPLMNRYKIDKRNETHQQKSGIQRF